MLYSLRTLVSHVSPVVVAILHGDCEDRLQAKSNKQKQKQKQPKKTRETTYFYLLLPVSTLLLLFYASVKV